MATISLLECTCTTTESVALRRTLAFLTSLAASKFTEVVHLWGPTCIHTPCFSCNPAEKNLAAWDQVTIVVNTADHHDQSVTKLLLQLLVNITEHMSVWESSSWKLSPIFLNGSSHITITKPTEKIHIHVFIRKCKQHVCSLVTTCLTALFASLSATGALTCLWKCPHQLAHATFQVPKYWHRIARHPVWSSKRQCHMVWKMHLTQSWFIKFQFSYHCLLAYDTI